MDNAPQGPYLCLEGLGPFEEGQMFQKYVDRRPVEVFCKIVSCTAPRGAQMMAIEELRQHSYTVRMTYKAQVFSGCESVFELDCEEARSP